MARAVGLAQAWGTVGFNGRSVLSVVPGALVTVCNQGTTTPISETIYADPTTGTTLANPLTTDVTGTKQFYLEDSKTVTLIKAATGYTFAPEDVVVSEPPTDALAGYQLTSAKGQANGYLGLGAGALAVPAQLGTGVASSATFLRGDSTWAAPTTSSSGTATNIMASGTVTGDGTTDDAAAINAIIATAGHYYFPGNRTYLVGDSVWIKTSSVMLEFAPGAIVRMKNAGNQPIMAIGNETGTTINNIVIWGGDFDGNASNQTWRIPHAGVGLGALSGHAAYYGGVVGIGTDNVSGLTFVGTRARNCLNNIYQMDRVGDVVFLGARGDGAGMSRSLKDVTGAADPEPNNIFNLYSGPPTTGSGKGIRLVGCLATNVMDVGFECHGNGLTEYAISGCVASGSAPAGTGNNIGAHTGFEFEMESADTANGGFGSIVGNSADNLNIAYSVLNTLNTSYDLRNIVLGPNQATDCTTALDLQGRHISITGLVAERCGTAGVSTNSIQAWLTATSIGTGNTTTAINFAAATFSATQQALLVGSYATITSGTQSGTASYRLITAATATQITVTPAFAGTPDATSVFKFSNHGDWTFTNCVFHVSGHSNGGSGYFLKVAAGVVLDGVTINGGVCHGAGSAGTDFLYSGVYATGNILNLEINGGEAHGFKQGIDLNLTQRAKINGGTWHHNNEAGIVVANNAITNTGSIIQNALCIDNGVNPTSGHDCGIYLDLAVDTILEGNVCTNSYSGGYQSYGIKVSANPTGVILKNGDLRGNASAATNGTLNATVFKEVSNVPAITDTLTSTALTIGASPYAPAASHRNSYINVVGGTVSSITVGGVSTGLTSGSIFVPAGKTLVITYSVVPTSMTQVAV